ncbi:MAG: LPS export ABC transporter ATP-binding protein [Parachlamydiales bacterium]|nr:LPS export ABC transporter ATP-binding protein [Parachlamydiales bacterium]
MNPLLKVQHLEKTYGEKKVVNDLSFEIHSGEVLGFLGPNGAGKTTAFYMVIGLIQPDRGDIFFHNINITREPIHKRAMMGMGYLAQEPSIFTQMSVEENILCILQTLDLPLLEQKKRLGLLLEELSLTHLRKKKAAALSGGERRRLEITRSLVREPTLLLLDEPFANIDPLAVQDVKKLILLLKKKNISILITDHNAREIFSIADRSYLIQDGRVMLEGKVDSLIHHPDAKKYYLGENFTL